MTAPVEPTVTVPRDLVELALSFAPDDAGPVGLDPTFYHTLSHAGDASIVERLAKLRAMLSAAPSAPPPDADAISIAQKVVDGYCCCGPWTQPLIKQIAAALTQYAERQSAEAVAAERERCAKVADRLARIGGAFEGGDAARHIANDIRAGDTKGGAG